MYAGTKHWACVCIDLRKEKHNNCMLSAKSVLTFAFWSLLHSVATLHCMSASKCSVPMHCGWYACWPSGLTMRFRLSTSPGSDHSIWLSHPLCLEQRSFILASHKSISPCDNTVTSTTDAMYSMYHVYVYSYVCKWVIYTITSITIMGLSLCTPHYWFYKIHYLFFLLQSEHYKRCIY